MKLFQCVLLFWLSVSLCQVMAQRHVCGMSTADQQILLERMDINKKYLEAHPYSAKNAMQKYVPLKIHNIAEGNGNGRLDFSLIIQQMSDLNGEFEDFTFYIKDLEVNNFNNSFLYDNPRSTFGRTAMISQKNTNGDNAMNLFITKNASASDGNTGTTLGYYDPSIDLLVVRQNRIGQGNNTLAHEVGHYFDLPHPHLGWEDDPWREEVHGLMVTRTFVGSSIQVEVQNGSNCSVAADRICDTPPDYNFGFLWNQNCSPFNIDVRDRNGDIVTPDQRNYMSYFSGCEPYTFTNDQKAIMDADFNSTARAEIRSSYVPLTDSIRDETTLLTPGFNETMPFYNGVEISWTASEHAQRYYVNVSTSGQELIFHTTDTILYLQDLLPSKTYTWKVHAYNEVGGGAQAKSSLFRTGSMTTSTVDPDFVSEIKIYPNPTANIANAIISLTSNVTLDAKLDLINMSGQILSSSHQRIQSGANNFRLDDLTLNAGIYFIRLNTVEGQIIRKIIIQ